MLEEINYSIVLKDPSPSFEVYSSLARLLTEYSEIHFKLQLVKAIQGTHNKDGFYDTFLLNKKNGKKREINVPIKILKIAQKSLLTFFVESFKPHRAAYGFIEGKSVIDNARLHVKKKIIYTVDIKNFFTSITWQRIYGMFQKYPFNFNQESARVLTNIVTYKGVLPQGAPTSPFLSNMICRKLDSKLLKYSQINGFTYSRYADDLTFSTSEKSINDDQITDIKEIIALEHFELNEKKERVMPFYKRQIVTGLVVNKKVNVKKSYIRNIKAILHNVNKSNWNKQSQRDKYFSDEKSYFDYINKNLTRNDFLLIHKRQKKESLILNPREHFVPVLKYVYNQEKKKGFNRSEYFKKVIEGKINFLGVVRGRSDKVYTKIKDEFDLQILLNQSYKLFAKYIRELSRGGLDLLNNRKLYTSVKEKLKNYGIESELTKLSKLIIEANWEKSPQEKDFLELYYSSMLSPIRTADFFRLFKEDDFFGGLVHKKEGQLNKLEMGEIYSNCKSYFDTFKWLFFLSNSIKDKLQKYLNEYENFIKENPITWPWDDKKFREKVIMPFRKDFRIENGKQATDLIEYLEKKIQESDFKQCNKKITLPSDCKLIYTDVNSVREAIVLILYSMADNSVDESIIFDMTYLKNKDEYNEVSVLIYDQKSIIQKEPELKLLFSNKLQRAVKLLRGIAEWQLSAKFSDNCSYQFDVMNNTKTKLDNGISGVHHKITFYY